MANIESTQNTKENLLFTGLSSLRLLIHSEILPSVSSKTNKIPEMLEGGGSLDVHKNQSREQETQMRQDKNEVLKSPRESRWQLPLSVVGLVVARSLLMMVSVVFLPRQNHTH